MAVCRLEILSADRSEIDDPAAWREVGVRHVNTVRSRALGIREQIVFDPSRVSGAEGAAGALTARRM